MIYIYHISIELKDLFYIALIGNEITQGQRVIQERLKKLTSFHTKITLKDEKCG